MRWNCVRFDLVFAERRDWRKNEREGKIEKTVIMKGRCYLSTHEHIMNTKQPRHADLDVVRRLKDVRADSRERRGDSVGRGRCIGGLVIDLSIRQFETAEMDYESRDT